MRLAGRGCPCGRAFTRLEDIEGRIEDVLQLPGKEGWISIHPIVFHHLLDQVGVAGSQVIQEPSGLARAPGRNIAAHLHRGSAPRSARPLPQREWCRPGWTCSWWITSNGHSLAKHRSCWVYQAGV